MSAAKPHCLTVAHRLIATAGQTSFQIVGGYSGSIYDSFTLTLEPQSASCSVDTDCCSGHCFTGQCKQ